MSAVQIENQQPGFFRKWRLIVLAALLAVLGYGLLGSAQYSSPQMEATVITPDGKPVAGAIVVVSWDLHKALTNYPLGPLMVAEAVTDSAGRFRIPAWGPLHPPEGSLNGSQPTVRIFRRGFIPLIVFNDDDPMKGSPGKVIHFRFQNRHLTLTPFKGDPAAYEESLQMLLYSLTGIYKSGQVGACHWKTAYRMLLALEELKAELEIVGAGNTLKQADAYVGNATQMGCEEPEQFFMKKRGQPGSA